MDFPSIFSIIHHMKLLNTNKLTEFLNIATHPKRSNKSTAPVERSDGVGYVGKLYVDFFTLSGQDLSGDGATCGRRSAIDTVCTRLARPVQAGTRGGTT